VAPGQIACLMDGELIVGHATIAASPPPAGPGELVEQTPLGHSRQPR
jgi:hypothetical protein